MTKHSIKAKDITKDHVIHLKVTANEKQILQRKAHDCRMSLSEFMLKAGLGRQIRAKVDTDNTEIILCLKRRPRHFQWHMGLELNNTV